MQMAAGGRGYGKPKGVQLSLFRIGIFIFIAIALTTGANDLLQGLASQRAFGATLSDQGFSDPMVDNVFRFFSALWFGVGVLFIVFIRDLDRYKPAMIALLGVVFLGGLGRILSIAQLGMPDHPMGFALVCAGLFAEIIVSPIMIWWLWVRHTPSISH